MADTIKIGNLEIDNLKVGTLSVDALYIGDVKIYPSTPTPTVFDIDLNNQWVDSTKTLDGYRVYMSNSNKGVDNGYASMKFKFKGMPDFKLWINSYAEGNFDYTIAWNLDVNYPTSNPRYNSTGVKAHTRGNQKDPTSISNFTEVDYPNDGGEHFVVVTYRKDSSGTDGDDRGYVAVKLTLISTTWVVSSTEFIKKDGKYYEKLTEVGTYEGGVTVNTGNYKEGNELTVTYKQGTADDYMIVGSGKYYKNYIYVTPKDQEINTGDYIQGDFIDHITNAMYVKYLDGSEKTFTGLTSISQNTDSNKASAKSVEIYDGVTSIGDYAFNGCSSLTSVTLPDSVTSIGQTAFGDCTYLTNVTLPSNLTSIGQWAFGGCRSFTSITIPNSLTSINNYSFQYCTAVTSVMISSSVTSIGNSAFYNCNSLTSVTIENSTSKISYRNNAFAVIDSNAKLYVPSNLLSDYQSDSNWTSAFGGGIQATGTIPTPAMKVTYTDNSEKTFYNLTTIDKNTDSNKASAKSVEIYDGVTSIGNRAFSSCESLTSITIPNSVTSIGESAFEACHSLANITLPSSITTIGNYAFYGSSLTSVTIPSNVTDIGEKAFKYCEGLASVMIENSTNKLAYNTDAFKNISSSAKLYVPSNLLSDYQADSKWSGAFGGGIQAIPS